MQRRLMLVSLCFAAVVLSQSQTKIRQKPIPSVSPASGQEMFVAYCASCHGKDAKGNGPAAAALKRPPTDLTLLSKNKGGKFDGAAVYVAISGQFGVAAHGSSEMPVWGRVFTYADEDSRAKLRLTNLTNYVKSLQAK